MKKQNGITLIALVITIVVLLILAGISISMVIGDNSIFKNAKDAKEQTNDSAIIDYIQMALTETDTQWALNGTGDKDAWYKNEAKGSKIFNDEVKKNGLYSGKITDYPAENATTFAIQGEVNTKEGDDNKIFWKLSDGEIKVNKDKTKL